MDATSIFDSITGSVTDLMEQIAPVISPDNLTVPDPSVVSVDYYRQKVVQFQATLNALDSTYYNLALLGEIVSDLGDPDETAAYDALLADFQNHRQSFVLTAKTLQVASTGINALGVQFPTVEIPGGLAALPALPLAAVAGAVAVAVALTLWATGFFKSVADFAAKAIQIRANAATQAAQLAIIQQLPADQQQAALDKFNASITTMQQMQNQADQALAAVNASPLLAITNLIKWIAIGGVVYLIYKEFSHGNR